MLIILLKSQGFNTLGMGWNYVVIKVVNYLCILMLIIYFFISLTNLANFTTYLNQQIILLVFIAMGFAGDYTNFCNNPCSSIKSLKS